MRTRCRVLGQLQVHADGRAVPLPAGQAPQLLAVLLLHADRPVPTGTLMELLWDGDYPASAHKLVQVRISQLRSALASTPITLTGTPGGYRLDLAGSELDVADFRDLLGQAGDADPDAAVPLLDAAVRLWDGPALPEIRGTLLGQQLAARLDEEHATAVEAYASAALATGADAGLADRLTAAVADHPLRERLRSLLLRSLHRAGRQAEAVEVYQRGRRLLADELGLDPGPELQAAYAAILTQASDPPDATDPLPRPAQLPTDVQAFIGRDVELARLDAIATGIGRRSSSTVAAITGTAGVGKTSLAVHWAHRHADRFDDGTLYVNLHGFDADLPPAAPDEVLRGLLSSLGVPPDQLRGDLDELGARYRTLLAQRRLLVLLDNARDTDQVRALLPGTGASLVVVTSRSYLSGLVAELGAQPVMVTLLTRAGATEFLSRRLGAARCRKEPAAVVGIGELCARLPLALAIVGARAAAHPDFPLAALAAELRSAGSALDALDGGERTADVRAVFSWSYRTLRPAAAAMFRLIGHQPGSDLGLAAAASLAGETESAARAALTELARAHLVEEYRPGRYRCHDLLRAYAAELATENDEAAGRDASLRRLLDHYLHTGHAAYRMLRPNRDGLPLAEPMPNIVVGSPGTAADALRWFEVERANLVAAIERAWVDGHLRHTWQLAASVADFLERTGHWRQLVDLQRVGLRAATIADDRAGLAHLSRTLGQAYAWLGEPEQARVQYDRALMTFEDSGDTVGQAHIQMNLGVLAERHGDAAAALRHTERALVQFSAVAHRAGQGHALNNISWLLVQRGDYGDALRTCRRALALLRGVGDRYGEANVLDTLGYLHDRLNEPDAALDSYRRALEIFTASGDAFHAAETLGHLGETLRRSGHRDEAADHLRRAVTILDRLGHPHADQLRTTLDTLSQPSSHER